MRTATCEVGGHKFEVAPTGRIPKRRTYELPLAVVAEIVAHRVQLREAAEKRAAKKARRSR